jgi:ParB family chromosome partitioning protein
MTQKKSGLGKNLNVLLSTRPKATKALNDPKEGQQIESLALSQIQPGVFQPRKTISDESINELSESIKQQGLLQPIAVRRISPDQFEIIAGERRFRAAQKAGFKEIPAIVHQVDDKTTLALAIIENIQREDLSPLEEAEGLSRLINEFDLTHQQAAELLSKSRASISNLLRLLTLAAGPKELLAEGRLEMGHARALLTLDEQTQVAIAKKIVALGLSVREAEQLVRQVQAVKKEGEGTKELPKNPVSTLYESKLQQLLGLPVNIQSKRGGRHRVMIDFKNERELETFLAKLD